MRSLNVLNMGQAGMMTSQAIQEVGRVMQGAVTAPGTSEDDYVKMQRLRKIRDEELYKRSLVANNDQTVRDITNTIDENNRVIHKLLTANEILVQSRQSHIDDAGKKYDEENPSTVQNEIDTLNLKKSIEYMEKAQDSAISSLKQNTKLVDFQTKLRELRPLDPLPYGDASREQDWYEKLKGYLKLKKEI